MSHPNMRCGQPGCGFVLARQNKSGYCAGHSKPSDRAERRFCAEPGCGKRLRSDNSLKFCFAHRCQKLRFIAKGCRECGKLLNAHNKSGYCTNHFPRSRPCHARAIAKASMQPKCAEPGCEKPANQNGYCRAHRRAKNRPSVKPQFCKKPGCRVCLRSDNEHGFCRKHQYLANVLKPKTCQEPGCEAVLGNNNKSGYCPVHWMKHYGREHRDVQRVRTAEFRARQQAKLAKIPTLERKLRLLEAIKDWQAFDLKLGKLLIDDPSIGPGEAGAIFDQSHDERKRKMRCPWGEGGWQRQLTTRGSAAVRWFYRIRSALRELAESLSRVDSDPI